MAEPSDPTYCDDEITLNDYAANAQGIVSSLWNFANARLSDMEGAATALDNYASGWAMVNLPEYEAVSIGALAGPAQPSAPTDVDTTIVVDAPYNPATVSIHTPSVGSAPSNTAVAPTIDTSGQPGAAPTVDFDAPDLPDRDIPDIPDTIDLPSVPTFHTLAQIIPRTLSFPSYDEVIPDFDGLTPPNATVDFTEDGYSSTVRDAVRDQLYNVLSGVRRIGIPESVWDELENAAADKINQDTDRLIDEATNEHFRRGWTQPGGALNKSIQSARFAGQQARTSVTKELLVKRAEQEVENMKYYTAQAIAYEQVFTALYNAIMDRRLRAAEATLNFLYRGFEAQVAFYEAKLAKVRLAAEVFEAKIRAELLKLEEDKFRLETNKLLVEQDLGQVQLYVAQVEAAKKTIELYESKVRAVATQIEGDRSKVAIFAEEVRAKGIEVDAWAKQWEGYRARIDGERAKVDIFRAENEAYVADVQAYRGKVEAELARVEADSRRADTELKKMEADVRRYTAQIEARVKQIDAEVELAKLPYLAHTSQAEWWRSQAAAYEAQYKAEVEQAKATATIALEGARIEAEQIRAMNELGFKSLEGQKQIAANLAASAVQGIHSSVSLSDTVSRGKSWNQSCSTSWSYSKDLTPAE